MKFSSIFKSDKSQYNVGLALSGGGVKGFAHLGVLKALAEENIKIDIISGTSAGALAAALYADGYQPDEILNLFEDKGFKQFVDLTTFKGGIFKSDKLHRFLKKHLRAKKFEDLKTPIRITATNVENGKTAIFENGDLIHPILASCAFPIVFTPIKIENNYYIDGGLLKNFPVSIIKKECSFIIGVNVNPITHEEYRSSLMYIAERTFHYTSIANTIPDRKICDILIEPQKVSNFKMFNLEHSHEIFDIGYESVKESFRRKKYITMWDNIKASNKK